MIESEQPARPCDDGDPYGYHRLGGSDRQTSTVDARHADWLARQPVFQRDPDTLRGFLDRAAEANRRPRRLTPSESNLLDEFRFHFPADRVGGASPEAMRAALALADLWFADRDVDSKLAFAATHATIFRAELRQLHDAVRGDRGRGWRTAVPWDVLAPVKHLPSVAMHRLAAPEPLAPPRAETLQELPFLSKQFGELRDGLRQASDAWLRLADWAWDEAARERAADPWHGIRNVGLFPPMSDQILDQGLLRVVGQVVAWADTLHEHCQLIERYTSGTLPHHLEEGPHNIRRIADPAAEIALAINRRLPDPRRYAGMSKEGGIKKHGTLRSEGIERAILIIESLYGVTIPAASLKRRMRDLVKD